jgi:hypothetical protein
MIIALISFRISFREGTVEGTILSGVCLWGEESMIKRWPFRQAVSEDRTIEEEVIAFSMFSTNLSITGLLNELQTVFLPPPGKEFCKGIPIKIISVISHLTSLKPF